MPLRTVSDIITEVLVRNNRTTTDSFITDAMLNRWLTAANAWATGYHKWPFTEGKSSTTFASLVTDDLGYLRGEYPEGWKSDSIRQLLIDGKRVQKLNWEDFQMYIENHTDDDERIYSDFGRSYFINPRIDLSGTVTAWGQYSPNVDATDTSATTVFSNYDEEGNEAIIEKMTGYLKRREHLPQEAELHDKRAAEKLEEIWNKIADEQYAYQSKDRGMFERIDLVNGGMYGDELDTDQF